MDGVEPRSMVVVPYHMVLYHTDLEKKKLVLGSSADKRGFVRILRHGRWLKKN